MNDERPLRVVLDTNVLLDLWLFDEPATRPLRQAIEGGRLRAMRSPACDAEFAAVLGRSRFGLAAGEVARLLHQWLACSEAVEDVQPAPLACTDPDDQKFLDVAFSAGAELLLTRDRSLLQLAQRVAGFGLRIASPNDAADHPGAPPAR